MSRFLTRIDIHPSASLGSPIFIDHGVGVVIGRDVAIGANVLIYQGVTIGIVGRSTAARTIIGESCMLGAGSMVLRGVTVGANSNIGANAVVVVPIPESSVAVGAPAVAKHVDTKIAHDPGPIDPSLLI
jgi:serine O-acetyltransferase